MEPFEFIEKWRASELKESSAAQEHFIDLCDRPEGPPIAGLRKLIQAEAR